MGDTNTTAKDTCKDAKDLPGSAVETIVLAIELADYELKKGPAQVLRALDDSKVQKAITDALQKQANDFLKQQKEGKPIAADDAAKALGKGVGKAVLDAGAENVKGQIKTTPQYQRLEKSLKDLECAYEKSAIGVFVDENKLLLVIVASGVAIGAATAMYVARAGDAPADWATSLAKDKLKTTLLGKLTLGVADVKFVPSKQELGLKAYAETAKSWKGVPASKFSVEVKAVDENVTSVALAGETRIPIPDRFSPLRKTTVEAKGSVDLITRNYALSLGVRGTRDGLSVRILGEAEGNYGTGASKVGVTGTVGYDGKVGGVPVRVEGGIGASRTTAPGPNGATTANDYRATLGVSIPFDFGVRKKK